MFAVDAWHEEIHKWAEYREWETSECSGPGEYSTIPQLPKGLGTIAEEQIVRNVAKTKNKHPFSQTLQIQKTMCAGDVRDKACLENNENQKEARSANGDRVGCGVDI